MRERGDLYRSPTPGHNTAVHIGIVLSVDDEESRFRVKVRLPAFTGVADQEYAVWARVATPLSGSDRGAFLIPDVGDEVLVAFAGGDPSQPVVVGSLWNGTDSPPSEQPSGGVNKYVFKSKRGTVVSVDESAAPTVEIVTPQGTSAKVSDDSGGTIRLQTSACSIEIGPATVKVTASGSVELEGATAKVSAGVVTVDAGMAKFSGVVKCSTLIADSVVGTSYTPGAGNVW